MTGRSSPHTRAYQLWSVFTVLALCVQLFASVPLASAAPATPTASGSQKVTLLVRFKPSTASADADSAVKGAGAQTLQSFSQIRTRSITVAANAQDAVTAALQKNPNIESVNPTVSMKKASSPNDPGYAQQWALPKIAWDQAYGSVNPAGKATIAVLDTGIDGSQPDLTGHLVTGLSNLNGVTTGDPTVDPNGHGTALAGIAAAGVNDATGMAGVAYTGTSIAPVQVLGSDGTGTDADVVAGVLWAADHGANVILMGFSSPDYSSALANAVSYAEGKGVVIVAATGNDGSTAASYPAGLPGVVGVASSDQTDALVSSSNTGSASVAAPGENILATKVGGGTTTISGTSPASAEVAGLAALLVANGTQDVTGQIRGAADPISGAGFGRINVAKALGAPAPAPAPAPTSTATPTPSSTLPTYVAAGNANVTGNVTDSVTQAAIAGATVTCNSGCSAGTLPVTTNGNGQYTLTQLNFSGNSTTITLTVTAAGYTTASGSVDVSNNGTYTKNFSLTSTVVSVATTTTAGSPTAVSYGATSVTLTATVTVTGSQTVTTGTVDFTIKNSQGTSVGSVTGVSVVNGSASTTYNPSTLNAGSYTIVSSYHGGKSGNTVFSDSSSDPGRNGTLTINKAASSISINNIPSSPAFGGSFTPTYTKTGDGTVSTSSSTTGVCKVDSNTGLVSFVGVGTCTLTASITGGTNYAAATGTPQSFNVGQANQALFTLTVPTSITYGTTGTATASGGSGTGTVTFSVGSSTGCTVDPATGVISVTNASGSCAITATKAGDSNYNSVSDGPKSVTLYKATATITLGNLNQTYDGTVKAATATTNSADLRGVSISYSQNNMPVANPTAAGSYDVLASLTNDNYTAADAKGTLAIAKANQTITFGALANKAYGDATFTVSATASSGLAVSFSVGSTDQCSVSGNTVHITGAGSCMVTASQAGDSNYNAATPVGQTVSIAKATPTVAVSGGPFTFDGTSHAAIVTVTGVAGDNLTASAVTYVLDGSSGPPTDTAPTNAGTYDVAASFAGNDNYTGANGNGQITINPAQASITINAASLSQTYDGTPKAIGFSTNPTTLRVTVTYSGAPTTPTAAGDYAVVVHNTDPNYTVADATGTLHIAKATATITLGNLSQTYDGTAKAATATTTPAGLSGVSISYSQDGTPVANPTNAGSYDVVASLANANYSADNATGTLVIAKATPIITWATPADIVYGTALGDSQLSATANVPGVFTYTPAAGTVLGAGSNQALKVDFVPTDAANYNAASATVTINVLKKALTITADNQSKTYDGQSFTAFTVSYSGLIASDNTNGQPNNGVLGGTLQFSGSAVGATGAGSYTITPGGLISNNYAITFVDGTLTVTARPVTITADAKSKTYGDSDPALTYKVTGTLVNNDGFTGSLARVSGEDVGSYTINQGTLALSSNYTLSYTSAQLAINPKSLTITASDQSKTYGEAKDLGTSSFTTDGLMPGQSVATVTLTSAGAAAGATKGDYAIAPSAPVAGTGTNLGNYTISYVNGTLTVGQAPLTVAPDNQSRLYGQANPDFSGTIDGIQNSDKISANYGSAANAGSPVGKYDITASLNDPDGKLGNYSVTLKTGTLTVSQAPLTVTTDPSTKVYGQGNPPFTVGYQGFVNNDDASTLGGTLAFSTTATAGSPVGSYDVTPSGLTSGNYTIAFVAGKLSVTPANLTVTPDNQSKVYGDGNPSLGGTVTGIQNGDNITVSYATTVDATSGVGSYDITATVSDNGTGKLSNYSVTLNKGTLKVTARPVTITADAKSKNEGDADPALTYQITGGTLVNGDSFSGSLTRDVGEKVGSYAITQGTVALSGNYALTYLGAKLTINNVAPKITAFTAATAPVQLGTQFTASVTFSDPGAANDAQYKVVIDWGNGNTSTQTVNYGSPVTFTYAYPATGVFTPTVTVTDVLGASSQQMTLAQTYVVVYDPNGGFVTGGGWIMVTPGSCQLTDICGTASGQANFGIVAKYKPGTSTATGNTEFQFQAGNLNFKSSSYVAGSLTVSGNQAQYSGVGTINGQGSYSFKVTATDGQFSGGSQPDKFRIKIWDSNTNKVVFDNQMGASDTLSNSGTQISGGDIVVHNK